MSSISKVAKAKGQFDLIAIGGATWDAIVTADEGIVLDEGGSKYLAYPYAKKVSMEDAHFDFGGGGTNVAVAASRLGLKTSFVGKLGPYRIGDTIIENLAREGVSTKYVVRDPKQRTGVSIVLTAPDGERTLLLFRGANDHLTDQDIDWQHCDDARWLYVSSLSGDSDAIYDKVVETATADHVNLAINPGATQIKRGSQGLHTALADSVVLLLNEEEARALLRSRGEAGETVPEMLQALQAINQGIVVITQGAAGAQAHDGQQYYQIDALTTSRVNTLGAGDAFGATFVVCQSKGLSVGESLRHASANASSVVSDYGAQTALLTWDELERRVHDAKDFQPTTQPA